MSGGDTCWRLGDGEVISDFEAAFLETKPTCLVGPPFRPGTIGVIGQFELLRKIGQGGMGIVYLAKPIDPKNLPAPSIRTTPGEAAAARMPADGCCSLRPNEAENAGDTQRQRVAVKILKPELVRDPRAVQHFRREASHLQKLVHPSILPAIEFSRTPGGDYLVMRYLESGSLRALLDAGRLTLEQLFRITCRWRRPLLTLTRMESFTWI